MIRSPPKFIFDVECYRYQYVMKDGKSKRERKVSFRGEYELMIDDWYDMS